MKKGQAILVTDQHRGIYFGRYVSTLEGGNAIKLNRARHCYTYKAKGGYDLGTFSLATTGPQAGSRIGPECTITIRDVATITECTDVATAAWEAATWGH